MKIAQGRYGVIEVLKAGGEPMILDLQNKVKEAMVIASSQNPLLLGAAVAMEEEEGSEEEVYE